MKRVSGPRPLIESTKSLPLEPYSGASPALAEKVLTRYQRHLRKKLNPPRVSLLVLRALCHRGRAHPPSGILTRLFSANCTISSAKRKTRQVALPDGPFRLVVAFWIQPLIF